MKKKKSKKIKLITTIISLLVILIIIDIILYIAFSRKSEILISDEEIEEIANNNQYQIEDEQLRKLYNELLGDGILIISKESAETLEDAQSIADECKNEIKDGISNELHISRLQILYKF